MQQAATHSRTARCGRARSSPSGARRAAGRRTAQRARSGRGGRRGPSARAIVAAVGAVCLLAAAGVGTWLLLAYDDSDAGATLVDLDVENMTHDEIVAALDEVVADNMMTISVAPTCTIGADGSVRVNVINDAGNDFDQTFALIQTDAEGDEVVLYESGVVEPGEQVEYCEAPGAVAGSAFIEIQAVVDGEAHGNPTRVEVTLVEEGANDGTED